MTDRYAEIFRPLRPKEIADLYQVTTRTLSTWLLPFRHDIGPRVSKFYSQLQVQKIYSFLGVPGDTSVEFQRSKADHSSLKQQQ